MTGRDESALPKAGKIYPPPKDPEADEFHTDRHGVPLRWKDADGVVHAAEGAQIVRGDPQTILMWTRCKTQDIEDGIVWSSWEQIGCRTCMAIEHEEGLVMPKAWPSVETMGGRA